MSTSTAPAAAGSATAPPGATTGGAGLPFDKLVRLMYSASNNEVRHEAIQQTLHRVSLMTANDILETAGSLLVLPEGAAGVHTPVVRAYGAVMLQQSIKQQKISAAEVPFESLANWFCREGSRMPPVLREAVAQLVVLCATRIWPSQWKTLFDDLCPGEGSAATFLLEKPHMLALLSQMLAAIVDDSLTLPPLVVRALRSALQPIAADILCRVVDAQLQWYRNATTEEQQAEGGGGAASAGGSNARPQQQHALVSSVAILRALCSVLPVHTWWALGAQQSWEMLLYFPPTAKEAAMAAGQLLRVDGLPTDDPHLLQMLNGLLQQLHACVVAPEYLQQKFSEASLPSEFEVLEEVLQSILQLPVAMLAALERRIATCVVAVLSIPSVHFAGIAMDLFRKAVVNVADAVEEPELLLERLFFFCQKHHVHPAFSRQFPNSVGIALSREQYGIAETVARDAVSSSMSSPSTPSASAPAAPSTPAAAATYETFDQAYGTLRGTIAHVLEQLALQLPVLSTSASLFWLQRLPNRAYDFDLRTPIGAHVQQLSQTFSEWSATHFAVDHLAAAFQGREADGKAFFDCLSTKESSDAVLVPVFLNLMCAMWAPSRSWSGELQKNVWLWSVDVMFRMMQLTGVGTGSTAVNNADTDLVSARKRSFTVFIHASHHHGSVMASIPELQLLPRCQQVLIGSGTLPSERVLLYEAISSLTNQMEPQLQERFLDPILGPMRDRIVAANPDDLVSLLCSATAAMENERSLLVNSVAVLSAIIRRCKPSPFISNLIATLVPVLGTLVIKLHALTPQMFPKAFEGVVTELSSVDRDQLLHGSIRKSSLQVDSSAVGRARAILQQLRLNLYQALGAVGEFVNLEDHAVVLTQMVRNVELFPVHVLRCFAEHTLIPWLRVCPTTATFTLKALANGIVRHSVPLSNLDQEIVTRRQMANFFKELESAVGAFCEIADWQEMVPNFDLETQVVNLLVAMIQSGFDPRGCAALMVKLIEHHRVGVPAAGKLFSAVAAASVTCPRHDGKDIDVVVTALVGLYTKQVLLMGQGLVANGVPEESVHRLNGSLSISTRQDGRKALFLEFLKVATGVEPQQVSPQQ